MPDEENERGKTAKNIFRCEREFFIFKAINVVNVFLVNKENSHLKTQLSGCVGI